MSSGLLRALGLPAAMLTLMIGFVFAVNPRLWGVVGVAVGTAVAIAGMAATVRIYRVTAPSPDDPPATPIRTDGDDT
ncbi:MAG: hypothetical protein R3195_08715 [Gemmatimonadota bacterium]|nr:hypothetical protein [Gemmatimonadota bacterium]